MLGLIDNDDDRNVKNNNGKVNKGHTKKGAMNTKGKNRTRRSEGVKKVLFDLPHFSWFPVFGGALWT